MKTTSPSILARFKRFIRDHMRLIGAFGFGVVVVLTIFGPILTFLDVRMAIYANIAILTTLAWFLLEYLHEIRSLLLQPEATFYSTQDDAKSDLDTFIREEQPQNAYLLEGSAVTVLDAIIKPLIYVQRRLLHKLALRSWLRCHSSFR